VLDAKPTLTLRLSAIVGAQAPFPLTGGFALVGTSPLRRVWLATAGGGAGAPETQAWAATRSYSH
jgi:hypothetical protein